MRRGTRQDGYVKERCNELDNGWPFGKGGRLVYYVHQIIDKDEVDAEMLTGNNNLVTHGIVKGLN